MDGWKQSSGSVEESSLSCGTCVCGGPAAACPEWCICTGDTERTLLCDGAAGAGPGFSFGCCERELRRVSEHSKPQTRTL